MAQNKQKVTGRTKTDIIRSIAEETGQTQPVVREVLTALTEQAYGDLKNKKLGRFTVPFLGVRLRRVHKPATKRRKGTNPFTGEEKMFEAKPARNLVKATVPKALKDAV